MSELRAEPLSPLDAATLWAQLHRLSTEVIATRSVDRLLISAGLAATGLTHLPRMPKSAVFGVKRGLGYRGVAVVRELAGGSGWEVVSLRLARDMDDETVVALLAAACEETAHRLSRTVYLRIAEGSPHIAAVRRSGMMAYTLELMFAPSAEVIAPLETLFGNASGQDRHAIFRLYCRAVPEHVRRQEASTQQEWRAVLDSYECEHEFVVERDGAVVAWVGVGSREARLLVDGNHSDLIVGALDLVETKVGRHGIVVLAEHQITEQRLASERGYTPLGTRLICARRLAIRNPLKEAIAVSSVETVPLAQ
jgi:hypothetical protein